MKNNLTSAIIYMVAAFFALLNFALAKGTPYLVVGLIMLCAGVFYIYRHIKNK